MDAASVVDYVSVPKGEDEDELIFVHALIVLCFWALILSVENNITGCV